jgi:hypothetical protein
MFLVPSRWTRRNTLIALLAIGGCALVVYPLFTRSRGNVEAVALRPLQPAADFELVVPRHYYGTAYAIEDPVSLAPWGNESYLVCNHSGILEVNPRTGETHGLCPEPMMRWRLSWHPSGLCVRDELIFIANDAGHDVLVMGRSGNMLMVVQRIVHEGMQSPANVALSADGQLLAVADHDGGRLWMFRRDGALEWSRELPKAHGVAFGPDFVVATGLEARVIRKYDLAGNVLASAGSFGFGEGKYLCPTGVFVRGDRILVSDAHTGKITVLDHSLKVQDWFGGNGPGAGLFNMPHGIHGRPGELAVCDTFKNRILLLNDAREVTRILGQGSEPLPWNVPVPHDRYRGGCANVSEAVFVRLPRLPEELWFPGYGVYWFGPRSKPKCVAFPQIGDGVNAPHVCWITTASFHEQKFILLGHSQRPWIWIVDHRGRCFYAFSEQYLWVVDGVLRTDSGEVFDPTPLVDQAAERFATYDLWVGEGRNPLFLARLLIGGDEQRVAASFVTPAGKQFWEKWRAASTPEEKQAAAREFDAALAREKDCIYLQEYFLRNTLCPEE